MNDFKTPPNNLDAEYSVLGGLLLNNDAFDQVHDLRSTEFYASANSEIYRAISELLSNRKHADIVTVSELLDSKDKLGFIGGFDFLATIVKSTPSSANIKAYAEIVKEKYILRQLLLAISNIEQDVYAHGDVSKKLQRAQNEIISITERTQSSEPQFVGDIMPQRIERFEAIFNGEVNQIKTGLVDLDEKLVGGLEGGQLVVIAARPAMGKSALAVQIAEAIQTNDKAGVIFSCEMPNGQIVDRIISAHARISSDKLRNGKFTQQDFDGLVASIPKLQAMNLLVDDKSSNVNSISSKSRSIKRKHGLGVIVIDYLQLLEGEGDIREQQISSISRALKKLAIELDIPIIALSQLNRSLEQRANKRPVMSDIRESGAIEQDADIILSIYRDEEYNPDSQDKGTAEIGILKNRSGSTGKVRLSFVGQFTQFENFAGSQTFENVTPIKHRKGFDYAG